jgi:hypothetical protein
MLKSLTGMTVAVGYKVGSAATPASATATNAAMSNPCIMPNIGESDLAENLTLGN